LVSCPISICTKNPNVQIESDNYAMKDPTERPIC
jgi:hypothetical protein